MPAFEGDIAILKHAGAPGNIECAARLFLYYFFSVARPVVTPTEHLHLKYSPAATVCELLLVLVFLIGLGHVKHPGELGPLSKPSLEYVFVATSIPLASLVGSSSFVKCERDRNERGVYTL